MAATDKQWFVGEDGCLSVGETVTGVTYHSSLNSIILTTKEPSLKILDATSGIVLQKSDLSGKVLGTPAVGLVLCTGISLIMRYEILLKRFVRVDCSMYAARDISVPCLKVYYVKTLVLFCLSE